MRVGINYGQEHLDVEVPSESLIGIHPEDAVPPLADPAAALREALEAPLGFPALRRALTPDDHLAIVLDERMPCLAELLTALLEHVAQAHVRRRAITLVCPGSPSAETWIGELKTHFPEVQVEVHDPTNRQHLSYLATTRHGRRIYLNRTAVDADQLIVLARRRFDTLLGYSGSEGAIYPVLSDEATRKETFGRLSLAAPGKKPWPLRREAAEVAWLLGAPFMIQVIEGAGDCLTHIVSGLADTSEESLRLLNQRWRVTVDAPADTVIAGVSGAGAQHTLLDLAEALTCAARVLKPGGRIVLLTRAAPALGAGAELVRQAEEPADALNQLQRALPDDMTTAFQWASAAQQATIYLLSDLPADTVEELFATPLEHAGQVQRLVASGKSCLFLPDAHKTLALLPDSKE
jgi:nickel-dependent lactate racemase